jgi:hypothetical protein
MSTTQTNQPAATNLGALLSASSELDQLKNENELLKIENEQLKRQIEQLKESNKKPNDSIHKLEEIIDERDDDIDTLKKEIDLSATTSVIAAVCHYDSGLSPRHHLPHFNNDDGPKSKIYPELSFGAPLRSSILLRHLHPLFAAEFPSSLQCLGRYQHFE